MIAVFKMPFADFDYAGWAEQIGLRVLNPAPNRFTVEGEKDDIDRFSAELYFEPETMRSLTVAGPAHSSASHYS